VREREREREGREREEIERERDKERARERVGLVLGTVGNGERGRGESPCGLSGVSTFEGEGL
jgi:hypothetical protein